MASVFLDFIAPNGTPDLTKLHIFESPSKDGAYTLIETVTAIGTQGNYISSYTTDDATSATDWFVIQWEDSKGAKTPFSAAVQGGTRSLVSEIVARMLLRDSALNEAIAVQEAEAAVSDYFNILDPYSIDPSTVSPRILSGLMNLALARTYISRVITTSDKSKWVAGLVSLDTSSGQGLTAASVKALIDLANRDLGRSFSIKLLLEEIEVAGGFRQIVGWDITRSIIEVQ
jgi:hypothetical protein